MVLVKIWILLSAWLCATGWILSALHALNGPGYLLALLLTAGLGLVFKQHWWPATGFHWPNWGKLARRFRRPAPLLIFGIALLSLAAGLHDAPQDGDTNNYRIPRVLHWLGASGWHWIIAEDSRLNIAGVGYEWLFTPLILLAKSDRWVFLPNVIAYFLLPGLIFSFLRRMQIVPRVAWWWSWLLASGWCYALQAGTTENDALSTIFALGAIDMALRAWENQSTVEAWLALLAASVLSAVKPTNLVLLLPCLVAVIPSWRLLLARPWLTSLVAGFCLLASFVPMAVLNWHYTGSWKGFVPEPGPPLWWHWGVNQELDSPFWGIVGNTFCLLTQNLLPPFFPWASAWNNAMQTFVQTPFGSHFASFENFGHLNRSVGSSSAALGLGVLTITFISLVAGQRGRRPVTAGARWDLHFWLRWAPWIALLVFMAKVGVYENARYLAPGYVLLFPGLLIRPGQAWLVRQRWWQCLVLLVIGFTVVWLGYVRGRQFIPPAAVAALQAHIPAKVFSVVNDYFQARASVASNREFTHRNANGESRVGYATLWGGCEPGMWLPLGSRRVERILLSETPASVRARGLRSIFVEDNFLGETRKTLPQWLARFNARLVAELTFTTYPGTPPRHLYFVKLNEDPAPSPR